ncbi:MAG: hypothetical protein E6I69_13830 [Chloroflexi bacterium]|nr:MAG: hypothetical protein E6I69_13830 [Chloroflexota bacterium]
MGSGSCSLVHGGSIFDNTLEGVPLGSEWSQIPFVVLPLIVITPLSATIGPIASYNLLILSSFPLTAWATFLLVRRLGFGNLASAFAGLAFAFSPYHIEKAMGNLAAGAVCSVTLNAELGFGMPALEAAAQGCTFVCPRVAGVSSHFRDGVEAFYFDEGDSEGLARILKRLVDEPRLAHRAGLAAWERARTSLTWRHHATAIATAVGVPVSAQPMR